MRILPVLDLMHGQVVRGIAGRRHEYQPIRSPLTPSAEPLEVALAFRTRFGFNELYLADLDAIAGAAPAIDTYSSLQTQGFTQLVDAGLRSASDAAPLLAASVAGLVAGLETLTGPQALADLVHEAGPSRLVFSLDLKNGQPLASPAWPNDSWRIAERALDLGVRRILVLDLARVGVSDGTGTETFCRRLKDHDAALEVLAGGGVRGLDDLRYLQDCGVDAVLVASALHDGRLTRAEVAASGWATLPMRSNSEKS